MMRFFWQKSEGGWPNNVARHYGEYERPANAYGMTSNNELHLLESYARDEFTGRGRIVDLGCWYGATTISLARGLQGNTRASANRKIEALDLFKWEAWMEPIARQVSLPIAYNVGNSFYEDVRVLLKPYGDLVQLEQQDLMQYTPPQGPIEFLFIDAMKNWDLADRIVSGFFPLLMAGKSYVVQQDFAYHFPEIATNHLIMWYLRDSFEWLHHVPYSCSVVYRCVTRPDPSTLPHFTAKFFTPDMIEEAYEYSLACVSPEMRIRVEVAKLNFLIEQGYQDAARRQKDRIGRASRQLDEQMILEVQRVAGRAVEAGVCPPAWKGELDQWIAAMLGRVRLA